MGDQQASIPDILNPHVHPGLELRLVHIQQTPQRAGSIIRSRS